MAIALDAAASTRSSPGQKEIGTIPNTRHFQSLDFPMKSEVQTPPLSGKSITGEMNLYGHLTQPLLINTNDNVTMYKTAGFFSHATLSWIGPLLKLGYLRPLKKEDVPTVTQEDTSEQNHIKFKEIWETQKKKDPSRKSSIFNALMRCFWRDIVKTGMFAFCRATAMSSLPLFIRFFINFVAGNYSNRYEGYLLVAALFLVKSVESFSQRHWYFGSRRLGIRMRSALMAAIYEKELTLSSLGKHKHAAGEIVNYIGVDAYRIGEFPWWFHWAWVIPYQITLAVVIFSTTVGLAAIPGLLLILLTILLNSPLAISLQRSQAQFMDSQDERLRATTELLNGMKVIKLQAWETKFKSMIDNLREKEYQWLASVQQIRSLSSVLYWVSPFLVGSVIFFACIILNIPLNSTVIFTVLATFRIVQEPIRMISDLLATLIQVKVSVQRLNNFLTDDELQNDAVEKTRNLGECALKIENGCLSWNPQEGKLTLQGINLAVKHGEKVAVCGRIGSGKSTLLYSLLGEVPKVSGVVESNGSVAYVAQTAWIQTGSIKENILFGMPLDEVRYRKALKACALEQDISKFSHGDLTDIGERGINLSGGQKQRIQLARAVYRDADIYILDDPFSAVDAQTASALFNSCILGALEDKTVFLVTHQVEFLPAFDLILVMHEGKIKQAGKYEQLLGTTDTFHELVLAHEEALENATKGTTEDKSENQASSAAQRKYSGLEILRKKSSMDIGVKETQIIQEEEMEIGDTGIKPYKDYVQVAGGLIALLAMLIGQGAFVSSQIASNFWLAREVSNARIPRLLLVGVYAALSVLCILFLLIRTQFTVVLGLKASKAFFERIMGCLIKAPMAFFDSTPTGRILNRLSADLSVVDLDIPFCFGYVLAGIFDLIGILIVMAAVTWEIIIIVIPLLVLAYRIQNFYLASSRELMRMNAASKAPIVSYTSETVNGAVTIRAYEMVEVFKRHNLELVDTDASLYFHTQAAVEWLTMRLEVIGNILLCVSTLLLVLLPSISPGYTGLAISYSFGLNQTLVLLVWWQCNFSNYIVSVERIEQYMHLPMEAFDVNEDNKPPQNWPIQGEVALRNLQIRYRDNAPLVLKGITCAFGGGQKIGIVGRTGSGKTTLISAIFRLIEPAGGSICIDGVDITSLGVQELRLRLGIIPQEPVLFRGTVRSNLDPLNHYSDSDIWEALHKSQLGDIVHALPLGFESPVSDDGANWSAGQRQLFCLGRVLLKRARVLVLDEATASIDSTTDALLQKVIREQFSSCTVLTVAHRIPTVINSDMIVGLQDGYMIEFDAPQKLMERRSTLFASLVAEYWAQSSHKSRENLAQYIASI